MNVEDVARFHLVACPATPEQKVYSDELDRPGLDVTGIILGIDVDPRVRIGPFDSGDFARQVDRPVDIEFGGKRVVCRSRLHRLGLSHTESLRITERYRRVDFGHMELDITYEDPGTFDAPLHVVVTMEFAADDAMLESVCNEAPQGNSSYTELTQFNSSGS